jgi:uncharacterized protein YcbK (DUF882 family)
MQLTPNFHLSEFACKDGTPVPEKYLDNVKLLAKNLQVLRDHLGKAIHINSAYRHPAYNKKAGGRPSSKHLFAQASDIRVTGVSSEEIRKTILLLIADGKMDEGGLGSPKYTSFTHYDVRGHKARW